jgi:hypothetical protein
MFVACSAALRTGGHLQSRGDYLSLRRPNVPVSNFILPSNAVDGNLSVLARIAAAFAPHEADPPAMSIVLDAGHLMSTGGLIETDKQLLTGIMAPTTNPRIDRVVVSSSTGEASVVAGTESASPEPPALPPGSIPVAQIALAVGTTAISNGLITDERALSPFGTGNSLLNVQRFTPGTYTYTPTPGTASVIVELVGGGGGGGGCAAAGAGRAAAGGGGGAGAFARARFTQDFAGVTITVGAGGPISAAGGAGNDGEPSSFGSLVSAPGGLGGTLGDAVTPPSITWGSNVSPTPSGANLVSAGGTGGAAGLVLGTNSVKGGAGGPSAYGGNSGGSLPGNGSGTASNSYGGGGGGGSSFTGGPARSGGGGNGGLVLVYEYA